MKRILLIMLFMVGCGTEPTSLGACGDFCTTRNAEISVVIDGGCMCDNEQGLEIVNAYSKYLKELK